MLAIILFVSLSAAGAADASTAKVEPAASSSKKLVCKSRPVLGSRISAMKICKTLEDWKIFENDLEASRRDINDRGARGCDMSVANEC
jgi:hypothetical protein